MKFEKTPVDIVEETGRDDDSGPGATLEQIVPAVDPAVITIEDTPYLRINVAVGLLAFIAIVAALYLARAFFVPLLIGILASYALSPLVEWMKRGHVPRSLSAALVLFTLVGGISWIGYSLSDDATAMIEKLPDAARKLRLSLSEERLRPTALQNMQEAAKQIEGAAADAGANTDAKQGRHVVSTKANEPSTWLRDYAVAQSALLFTVVSQAPIVLLLTYFLLASGAHFRRKLVQLVGPSLIRKKDAALILDEIDVQIQRYLLTMIMSNALVGVGIWLAFNALGMEHAAVWGVAASVLHFIPYLGPALVAFAGGVAAFMQFGSVLQALAAVGLSFLVAGGVGFVFMPWLQSRFAGVNSAVLFISLLFFGWLWGVWGLLLGAPLVAIAKVICDRVEALKPVGELLGR
ncbi:MAG TPA: AI-2E family transporter [Gallionellaceae bacterium]|nr:AI-2E family transporter [Gallionellaceae bacterium]